jgi:predicted RNA-binding protein with PIN domain
MAGTTPDTNDQTGRPGFRGRWLIDGMNLIGSRADRWWNDPDRAVRRLIEELDRFGQATGQDVTVVFDHRPPDLQPGSHGTVRVAFASRRGRNAADHEIVQMVERDVAPGSVSVVTSDRRLGERVRELGARVASTSAFRRRLDAGGGLPAYRSDEA